MTRIRGLIGNVRGVSAIGEFRKEADGIALAFFLVALPVFIGLSLLAIDIGRGNNLHYDLQKAVDALALAAARELDGGDTAIARADAALEGMLQNGARFNDGPDVAQFGLTPDNISVDYLCDLPVSDDMPIADAPCNQGQPGAGGGLVTTQSKFARFAWVRARNIAGKGDFRQAMTTLFPITLASGSDTVAFGAEAVAGGTQGASGSACGVAPIFICDPFENDPDPNVESLAALTDPSHPRYGSLVEFRGKGNNSQHGPGNWGWLDKGGASELRHALAAVDSGICIENGTVTTKPGYVNNAVGAINFRFDNYDTNVVGGSGETSDANYAPAPNVRGGYETNAPNGNNPVNHCDETLHPDESHPDFQPLGGDANAGPGNVIDAGGGEVGLGDWNFEHYWQVNFGHAGYALPNDPSTNQQWNNSNRPSRWDIYNHELDWNGGELLNVPSIGGETGAPNCHSESGTPANLDRNRRLLTMAVIQCDTHAPKGRKDLPVAYYAKLFITRPMVTTGPTKDEDATIQGEIVEVTNVDTGGTFGVSGTNPEVLLYR